LGVVGHLGGVGRMVLMRNKQPPSKTSTRMLVFEGGCLVVVKNNQLPSKTSTRVLIFESDCLVVVKNNQSPSKTSARARFRGCWDVGNNMDSVKF
jgi:ribosomal protein L14